MTLRHKTRFNTSGQGFKKRPYSLSMLSLLVKIALIANRVFFKTLPRSVKTSLLVKIALIANRVFFKTLPRSVKRVL